MAGKPIDVENPRDKARLEKAMDQAILENAGERNWEGLMGLIDRALVLYDDPAWEPDGEEEEV